MTTFLSSKPQHSGGFLDGLITKEQQQGMLALGAGGMGSSKTGMGQNQSQLLMRNALGLGGGNDDL